MTDRFVYNLLVTIIVSLTTLVVVGLGVLWMSIVDGPALTWGTMLGAIAFSVAAGAISGFGWDD